MLTWTLLLDIFTVKEFLGIVESTLLRLHSGVVKRLSTLLCLCHFVSRDLNIEFLYIYIRDLKYLEWCT